jgi:hypothetical protein
MIDPNGDRVPSFLVWNFESGYDAFYQYMKIDLGNSVSPVSVCSSAIVPMHATLLMRDPSMYHSVWSRSECCL